MTPSLFGDDKRLAKKKEKKPHPFAPYFAAIAEIIGPITVRQATGRVSKIAKQMRDAGLTPDRVREITEVVARWAPWRKIIDLGTLQMCWPWILEPPLEVSARPDSLALMDAAIKANGGEPPL